MLSRNLVNGGAMAYWGLLHQKKRNVCHLPGGSRKYTRSLVYDSLLWAEI
jgi:hypothetical protein